MLNSVILSLMSAYTVIGIILTFEIIIKAIRNKKEECPYILIAVKNQAEQIEGIIRTLMQKYPYSDFLLIDLGSTDDTRKILMKLSDDYSRIEIKGDV